MSKRIWTWTQDQDRVRIGGTKSGVLNNKCTERDGYLSGWSSRGKSLKQLEISGRYCRPSAPFGIGLGYWVIVGSSRLTEFPGRGPRSRRWRS